MSTTPDKLVDRYLKHLESRILTDQGRQYVSWRGKTAFVEELRRQGIEHIKSRPRHPQTLGKVERFWK